jgi:thiol-disulfide isomerase/thioredoxin
VFRVTLPAFLVVFFCFQAVAQETSDPVAQALAQGDLYLLKRKYELAFDAYQKADKLSHHTSAAALLKIATIEKKVGAFPLALDDAKKAIKAGGDNKTVNIQVLQFRASLLAQMAGKPTDKKLKEAEEELRKALALDPANALTHLDLGMILLRQERDAEGIPELNTYIASPGAIPATVAEARLVIANPIRARMPFAPKFSFITDDNQKISNASLRGKVVLLDFWGTWCPPCRESVPILRDLNKKYTGKAFQLVGVSSDDDEEVWKTFIQAQHMNWPDYIDLTDEVQKAFKIDSYPTFIVLDKDGLVRFRQSGVGEATASELSDAINKALKHESDPKLAAVAAAEASSGPTANGAAATDAPSAGSSVPVARASNSAAKKDSDSPAKSTDIEAGIVSGNSYRNAALGMTFQFPQNLIPVGADALRAVNDRNEAAAKAALLQQHPELANSPNIAMPRTVFYASRKGQWDGRQLDIPSIRINAVPSRLDEVNLDNFQLRVEKMAAASGLKLTGPPVEFRVNKHPFVRADFDRSVGSLHMYQSMVQTIAGDYLLTVEIYAYSADELQQVAASLQTMAISDEDP